MLGGARRCSVYTMWCSAVLGGAFAPLCVASAVVGWRLLAVVRDTRRCTPPRLAPCFDKSSYVLPKFRFPNVPSQFPSELISRKFARTRQCSPRSAPEVRRRAAKTSRRSTRGQQPHARASRWTYKMASRDSSKSRRLLCSGGNKLYL